MNRKKILLGTIGLLIPFMLSSCSLFFINDYSTPKSNSYPNDSIDEPLYENSDLEIYDSNLDLITKLDVMDNGTLVGKSLIYLSYSFERDISKFLCHKYDLETKEDSVLWEYKTRDHSAQQTDNFDYKVPDYWYSPDPEHNLYEAYYCRLVVDNTIYMLITTGEFSKQDSQLKVELIETNIEDGTHEIYTVSEKGHPYSFMAKVNDTVAVLNHEQAGNLHDQIFILNKESKTFDMVLNFNLSTMPFGNSIRGIYQYNDSIYLLRNNYGFNDAFNVYLDIYDNEFKKQSELDVTNLLKEAAGMYILEDDIINDLKAMCATFKILDENHFEYESFGSTRCIVNFKENTVVVSNMLIGFNNNGPDKVTFLYDAKYNDDPVNSIYDYSNGLLILDQTIAYENMGLFISYQETYDGNSLAKYLYRSGEKIITRIVYR